MQNDNSIFVSNTNRALIINFVLTTVAIVGTVYYGGFDFKNPFYLLLLLFSAETFLLAYKFCYEWEEEGSRALVWYVSLSSTFKILAGMGLATVPFGGVGQPVQMDFVWFVFWVGVAGILLSSGTKGIYRLLHSRRGQIIRGMKSLTRKIRKPSKNNNRTKVENSLITDLTIFLSDSGKEK